MYMPTTTYTIILLILLKVAVGRAGLYAHLFALVYCLYGMYCPLLTVIGGSTFALQPRAYFCMGALRIALRRAQGLKKSEDVPDHAGKK
ncbi:hypothetical protein TNCV_4270321 [Trichonephila clavipes]|nr:hypothetical protein TNCV_4270321 [Trichonephila clavipes]